MHTIEEIAALLNIHKAASEHGGAMGNIASAALNRLRQINTEMTPDHLMEPVAEASAEEVHEAESEVEEEHA